VIPLADLLAIRLVSVLLYMYLELTWMSRDQCETIKIEFNAVGERMIKRELDHVRAVLAAQLPSQIGTVQEVPITHFPFKFQSYTYEDLLPGEKICLGVCEPKIQASSRYIHSYLSPNRVFVLTDKQLLVLEDRNRRFLEADLSEYWMERCFYPRAQIRSVQFEPQPNVTWMHLCLGDRLAHEVRLPLLEPRAAVLQDAVAEWLAPSHLPAQ
jgi:hypothetical protein